MRLLLTIKIAGNKPARAEVSSYETAAMLVRDTLEAGNHGSRDFGGAELRDPKTRKVVAYVSFNGRVWAGTMKGWKPGATPLWEPPSRNPPERPASPVACPECGSEGVTNVTLWEAGYEREWSLFVADGVLCARDAGVGERRPEVYTCECNKCDHRWDLPPGMWEKIEWL